jgi:hypothetical protein
LPWGKHLHTKNDIINYEKFEARNKNDAKKFDTTNYKKTKTK